MTILDYDTESYVNKFKDSDFSASDFLKMFVIICSSQNKFEFNVRSLVNYICICKENNRFNKILSGISLRSNGIWFYSDELDEAVSRLKFASILYTTIPSVLDNVYIFDGIQMTEFMKLRMDYYDEMCEFVSGYALSLEDEKDSKLVLQD